MLDPLQLGNGGPTNPQIKCITVIQPGGDKGMDQIVQVRPMVAGTRRAGGAAPKHLIRADDRYQPGVDRVKGTPRKKARHPFRHGPRTISKAHQTHPHLYQPSTVFSPAATALVSQNFLSGSQGRNAAFKGRVYPGQALPTSHTCWTEALALNQLLLIVGSSWGFGVVQLCLPQPPSPSLRFVYCKVFFNY
ncbi:hypothetical protein GOODEAATRI_013441 [Goodea atripinnis]|uniref:Uncharacterized protein n=1 Tax=Goodea atripinnis TaxID=208336 RepID=A0ABV0NUB2_9TELE